MQSALKPERWQHVEELVHEALRLKGARRVDFLEASCAGDESLRREVESLLAHETQAENFIQESALELGAKALAEDGAALADVEPPAPRMTGRMVSHYRILDQLGEGGMGAVYRAVRADDEYRKQVAIKLVRPDFDAQFILDRFKNERQILANLEHPNIARLLDGGTTEEGLPFFVMELVEGEPIDQYCDSRKLPTLERLQLFRSVCSAAQYAHQHLVIHCDLKPGNILVTSDGVPKLLDFGIAKILKSDPLTEAAAPTVTVLRMMTPEYASPEQLRGDPISTATDVYSLGVVLYYLLTGRLPYRLPSRSPYEIAHAICESEPEKPSTAVSRLEEVPRAGGTSVALTPELVSGTREGHPEKLKRRLRGDLDYILLKALRKEPAERYSSVEQFSEDIRRHLDGLPVIARTETLRYRSGKFIRRHRTAVAAAGLIFLTLIAGITATAWQARIASAQRARAEKRFNDVRDLANSLFDINDSITNLPGATAARKLLITKALKYLDSLALEAGGDPSLQRELATAYQKVGDIQGLLNTQQNLGHSTDALDSYRKAAKIREALAAAEPANPADRRNLATLYRRIGELSEQRNDFTASAEYDAKALAIYEAVHAANPSDAKSARDLGVAYYNIGRHRSLNGDWAGALPFDRKASAIFEPLATAKPADTTLNLSLAAIYREACYDLSKTGERASALDLCHKAVDVSQRLASANGNDARVQLDPYFSYSNLGMVLLDQGDLAGSLGSWRKALATGEAAVAADPRDMRALGALATACQRVGWLLVKLGQASDVQYGLKALEIRRRECAADPMNRGRQEALADSLSMVGDTEVMLASRPRVPKPADYWRAARSWYKQAQQIVVQLRTQGALRGEDPETPERIAREIAKCDAALQKLATSAGP